MKVTVKQIAKQAGVSLPTAYEALRGDGRMRDETRQRIIETAERLGYRPNRNAQFMRKNCHGTIGLLVHSWFSMPKFMINHLTALAHKNDLFILLEQANGDGSLPRLLREDCIDSLILFETLAPSFTETARKLKLPVVEVNTNNTSSDGCIAYDESEAVRQAVKAFAKRGKKRPAYLVSNMASDHYSQFERIEALKKYGAEAGMAEPVIAKATPFHSPSDDRGEKTRAFLRDHPEIDSVIFAQDALAPLFYYHAADMGKRIPEDLAAIGFNDYTSARTVRPTLTSLGIDLPKLSEHILKTLAEGTAKGRMPAANRFPYSFIERDSC